MTGHADADDAARAGGRPSQAIRRRSERGRGAGGARPRRSCRRAARRGRRVRGGEEHSSPSPRLPRPADGGPHPLRRPRRAVAIRGRSRGVPQPRDRLRLPVPPAAGRLHGARERHAGRPDRARGGRPRARACDGAARAGRARRAPAPPARRALRRRAAARGGRAGGDAPPAARAGRRADGQPRSEHRRARTGPADRSESRDRRRPRGGDAQRAVRLGPRPLSPARPRPARVRDGRRGVAARWSRRTSRVNVRRPALVALAMFLVAAPATVAPTRAQTAASAAGEVVRVEIEGNVRVEDDAIRVNLESRPGAPLDPARVDRDVRAIYAMGFFDQVDVEVRDAPEGGILVFRVKERPLVRKVEIEGTDKVKREDVEGALRIRPHTIFDPTKAREGVGAARKLYAEKGYLDASIDLDTKGAGENEVDVVYTVKEGSPIRVEEIRIEGNEAFGDRRLRRLMQTKTGWILSRFTGAGNLNRDVLRTDAERLTAWYYDHGYVTVRVDEPEVERREDGLLVRVKIEEGEQFRVSDVRMEGENLPADQATLLAPLETKAGEVFSAGAVRDDVQALVTRLSDDGYAFATVEPATDVDVEARTVTVRFEVDRGKPVVVERIEVSGNTKTRDKVLRREMRLQEQELFSGTRLRKSRESLQRLGFFREVNIGTRRGARDDRLDLIVDVKEGQTGAVSAGAGFSSADALLLNVQIQENNRF